MDRRFEKYKNKIQGLTEGIPEAPREYIIVIPQERIFEVLSDWSIDKGLVMALIEFILLVGKKWLKQRIKNIGVSIIGTKIFVKLEAPKDAVWDLLDQIPQIERIDYNFMVSIPPEPTNFGGVGVAKNHKGISVATHETTKHLGFTEVHKDPRFEMGKGLRVGVMDTGIGQGSQRNPQLFEDPKDQKSPYRVTKFKDFTRVGYPECPPYDDHFHGNCVASILAGGPYKVAGKEYIGALPKAEIYGAKVLDRNGRGTIFTIIQGIEWMVEQGPDIINMSLGSNENTDGKDVLSQAVDEAWDMGIVMVVAAGNSGDSRQSPPYCNGTIGTPACAFKVIKAAASSGVKDTKNVKKQEVIMTFSSRPPTKDGRKGPDFHMIAAPGYKIEMYDYRGTGKSGTSYASPYDAGHVGVVIKALQVAQLEYSPDTIRSLAEKYCASLGYKENFKEVEAWCIEGHGRIQPLLAWNGILAEKPEPEPEPEPKPPEIIPVVSLVVKVNGKEAFSEFSKKKMNVSVEATPGGHEVE